MRYAQARLLGRYTTEVIKAEMLEVTSYAKFKTGDTEWERINGRETCRYCSGVGLSLVRRGLVVRGTDILRANVVVGKAVAEVGGADLYLVTV